jgi:hypothetical protein
VRSDAACAVRYSRTVASNSSQEFCTSVYLFSWLAAGGTATSIVVSPSTLYCHHLTASIAAPS